MCRKWNDGELLSSDLSLLTWGGNSRFRKEGSSHKSCTPWVAKNSYLVFKEDKHWTFSRDFSIVSCCHSVWKGILIKHPRTASSFPKGPSSGAECESLPDDVRRAALPKLELSALASTVWAPGTFFKMSLLDAAETLLWNLPLHSLLD